MDRRSEEISLAVLAVLEAAVIFALVAAGSRYERIIVTSPSNAGRNPLQLAIAYESSVHKFEELARAHPEWLNYQGVQPDGAPGVPPLFDVAVLRATNYARILIRHGANVEKAVKAAVARGATDEVDFLRALQDEYKSGTQPGK